MSATFSHLSDEQLLLLADGEVSPWRRTRMQAHLDACWECRSRMRRLDTAISGFVELHHAKLNPQLPPIEGPRALLKAQLAQQAADKSPQPWYQRLSPAFACVAFFVFALGVFLWQRSISSDRTSAALQETVKLTPDRQLTPGAARRITTGEVCKVRLSDDTRLLPASLQRQVLQEYGVRGAASKDYELDYLISPQLGGTDDIRNLWPEPASAVTWNLRDKDALEGRLHELVCQGKLNLATAQSDLATDWISAYKHYFHTDRPIQPL